MTEDKHILILPMDYPEADSPPHRGYRFHEQALQLADAGCQVGLAYVEQRSTAHLSWKRFMKESHFQTSIEDNGRFVTLRMHAWNTRLSTRPGGFIWSLLTLYVVSRYIRRYGRPDLIHAHTGLWAGYAARLVKRIYGIRYVLTEHASFINAKKVTPQQERILRKIYEGAERIICEGTMLAKNLSAYTTYEKIRVIPGSINTETFSFSHRITEKENQFVFISVGSLIRRKGFDELIHAFNQVFADMTHVSLVIAGDGPEFYPLLKLINYVGLKGRVHLTGNLPRQQLAWCLSESDAFVLASHSETFAITVVEAMATGIPAIGTVCGGPEDIILPGTGLLVEPRDTVGLAQKMKQMYEEYEQFDKELIHQVIIEQYDSREASKLLLSIYQQALQKQPAGRSNRLFSK